MESCIGEYITKEYGLLKQILSYLEPCDLRNAKLVCRDWRSAVESLLDKNPLSLGIWGCGDVPVDALANSVMLPALVIHQNLPLLQQNRLTSHPDRCKMCKQSFFVCPCRVSDSETMFISLDSHCHQHMIRGSSPPLYMFWQAYSAFLLPSSPKIRVSTFSVDSKSSIFKEPITDDVVNLCIGGPEPIKCLIIILKVVGCNFKTNWLNQLINQIINRQGLTFAVGGGDIRGIRCKKGFDFTQGKYKNPNMVLIALRGEGVTAHSDILSSCNEQKIETFMMELSSRVGPLPDGAKRVAFITQCVDRTDETIEGTESDAFSRAFPTVPQYGFRAYGEYGIRSCSSGHYERQDSRKRMKMTFNRSHTTSVVILTFNKV